MPISLTDIQREDERTYVGPAPFRLPGKSARLARVRRNRQRLASGGMLRPRLVIAAVHSHAMRDYSAGRKILIQYDSHWTFARGDTFPDAKHGLQVIHYGDHLV